MAKRTAKRVSFGGKWRYRSPSGRFISKEQYQKYKSTEREFKAEKRAGQTVNETRDSRGKLQKEKYRPKKPRELLKSLLAEFDPFTGKIPKPDVTQIQGVRPHLVYTYKWYFRTAAGMEAAEQLCLRLLNLPDERISYDDTLGTVNIGSGYGKGADWVSAPWLPIAELVGWFARWQARPSITEVVEENETSLWVEFLILTSKPVKF